LSVISYQLSVISYQLSVISYQLSVIGSSGFCVETRSILIEYPQNSLKSLVQ
ncbi:MAG: hypothetical protein IM509_05765, partial [Microcystis sp. M31BS1]|nr:hypothetical protein [Microcystis sp. M31BS1]